MIRATGERRRAMVLGCAGQDGSYVSELLVDRGYTVLGALRGDPSVTPPHLAAIRDRMSFASADLADSELLHRLITEFRPDEVYNFAAVSFGPDAWTEPARTAELSTVALAGLLEALRRAAPAARFFQASSAWVFGRPDVSPQDESTPLRPTEPYGAAKAYGNFLLAGYRERYGMHCCSGILYNHESPRRPSRFVTRKITSTAAAIKEGRQHQLLLGDLDARRDWGYAKDYVAAAWLSLQHDVPQDYVIATGKLHTVRELVERAFDRLGLNWRQHVEVDPAFLRPPETEVRHLVGDASRARLELGWEPRTDFASLVDMMVDADLNALRAS